MPSTDKTNSGASSDRLAVCLLGAWLPFPAPAAAQALMILLGYFDPVRDDMVPADSMAFYWINLLAQIGIATIMSGLLVTRWLRNRHIGGIPKELIWS